MISRRSFVSMAVSGASAGWFFSPANHSISFGHVFQDDRSPLDADLVNQFVGRSHGNFDAVKEMLEGEPQLVHASWDWGNGDWETGLGAASHVGRRDIAEYLLEHGARIDAFAATMLGMTELLRALLSAQPDIADVPGPHGIPLLSHAVVGRAQANDAFDCLIAAGVNVDSASTGGMTNLMMAASTGNIYALEQLIEAGADPDLKDSNDRTALDWAKQREQADAIAILENL